MKTYAVYMKIKNNPSKLIKCETSTSEVVAKATASVKNMNNRNPNVYYFMREEAAK